MNVDAVLEWLNSNLVLLVVVTISLILLYVYSGPLVHKAVRRMVTANEDEFTGSGVADAELEKRSATIETLATTLLRVGIISFGLLVVAGLTGGGWLLFVIGLFLAGLAIAGQSIVLDYLMGVLIIVEGQFFQGDNIEMGQLRWKGTVESVGLRRTTVRDVDGTVYSISNGELRLVANRTRIYAAAEVRVRGVPQGRLAQVIEIMGRVGQEIAEDPTFADAIIDAPGFRYVDESDELGNIAVMRGKVVAAQRWRVSTEVRVRLDQALTDAGIELNRRAIPQGLFAERKSDG